MEQHPIKINKVQIRNLQIEDYVQSVSYTHLDVYKRQYNKYLSGYLLEKI